ncbi:erythromycin 3''-O-methyltransferase-like isoform X2 [Glandiceps talaboti]
MTLTAVTLCKIQPNHNVLEIGFGPGLGLQEAVKFLEQGKGKLVGVEFSPEMVQVVSKRLETEISTGLVEIKEGSVMDLPLDDNVFDRVYHCNCYYFWPDLQVACQEILRVMKPGGVMVVTLDYNAVKMAESKGNIPMDSGNPETFMTALKSVGFVDVIMQDEAGPNEKSFQAIYATAK